jgi:predicted dehydrogenase
MPPLRLVAVGCGRVFERFHLPALRRVSDWSLAGVVDTSAERLRWAATHLPGVPTANSLSALLSQVQPDAVLISTSPESHCALAAAGLRGGAHVLIEKPMVLHGSEAELLLDLSISLCRQIRVGFNRRFRPAYVELRRRLASHPETPVRSVHFELCSDPQGWGSVSEYLGQPAKGGGLLEDIASHQLDLVPWVLGRQVSAVRGRYVQRTTLGTTIALELRFPGELVASCLAGHETRYSEWLEVGLEDRRWTAGPAGLTGMGTLSPGIARRYLDARGAARGVARKLLRRSSDTLETFRRQFLAWADVLRSPEPEAANDIAGADGQAGARCVALVEGCRRSLALDNAWVDISTIHMPMRL